MTPSPFRRISKSKVRGRKPEIGILISVFSFLIACFCAPHPAHALLTNDENAIDVLGQFSSSDETTPAYTTSCANDGNATSFNFSGSDNPSVIIDSTNHRLFVSDSGNYRILVFTLTAGNLISSKTPAYVLGQPDFTTCAPAQAGLSAVTQSGMGRPSGMDFDATNNRLFVADGDNNRVLVFNTTTITNGMNASYVLGQADFTHGGPGTTQAGMYVPFDVKYDSANKRVFVAEQYNNRVTVWNADPATIANGENASKELGQPSGANAFTTSAPATSQSGMNSPVALAYDSANTRLYVADLNNNRVLIFNVATGTIANGENASNELDQPSGTAFTTNTAATTQSGMLNPAALAYDSAHTRLFVGEYNNSRVTVFNTSALANGMNAANVLGEPDFVTNGGGTTQATLSGTAGIAYDSTNNQLYVADQNDNRVMLFPTTTITNGENASDLLGQYTSLTSTATVTYTQSAVSGGLITLGFYNPSDVAVDAVHHRLFVVDTSNNRVLVYNLNVDNSIPDRVPDYVLGEPDFVTTGGGTTQFSLEHSQGLAYDAVNDRLFVADSSNVRVMVFNTSTITNGMNASFELGQPSGANAFTTNDSATTQSGMAAPIALAYDAVNSRLFVAEYNNARVTVFNVASGTIANGENASFVLGQPNFTTNTTPNLTQSGLDHPNGGLAYDAVNSRLFVSDGGSSRVLVFNVAPGTIANGMNASRVLGNTDFVGTNCCLTTQSELLDEKGLSYDATNGRLFVADSGNQRVLVFKAGPSTIVNGENASWVLGQVDYVTSQTGGAPNVTQSGMALDFPSVATSCAQYDPATSRLFVCDTYNNRVMIFDGSALTGNFMLLLPK